jgi:hypothetical protein
MLSNFTGMMACLERNTGLHLLQAFIYCFCKLDRKYPEWHVVLYLFLTCLSLKYYPPTSSVLVYISSSMPSYSSTPALDT